MNGGLAIPAIIVATYGTPPAAWYGLRVWLRRRQARQVADAAELVAIDAWLERIRSVRP